MLHCCPACPPAGAQIPPGCAWQRSCWVTTWHHCAVDATGVPLFICKAIHTVFSSTRAAAKHKLFNSAGCVYLTAHSTCIQQRSHLRLSEPSRTLAQHERPELTGIHCKQPLPAVHVQHTQTAAPHGDLHLLQVQVVVCCPVPTSSVCVRGVPERKGAALWSVCKPKGTSLAWDCRCSAAR